MAKRAPESQPDPDQPDVSPDAQQKWEDFHDSSRETQGVIRNRDETEAWELHAEAHEIYRDEALAGVRSRLHRLEQSGVEVTPEIEARELEHAEQSIEKLVTLRNEKGQFQGSARVDAVGNDAQDGRALDAAVAERAGGTEPDTEMVANMIGIHKDLMIYGRGVGGASSTPASWTGTRAEVSGHR